MDDDKIYTPSNDDITNLPQNVEAAKGVENLTIENVMQDSYLKYSMSVIVSRALPDVRDGLKPVHRRILHVMNLNNLGPNSKYRKSATIIGDVMGKFHPHGDSSIYDAMARMAQPWSLRYMLVDGQGNFGSMDGDPPAAMRYTEARMTKLTGLLLEDIEKDTVDFRDNYDQTEREPVVLPARLPNLLLNGQLGIAVGMATSIPTHNISEIVDATVALIDNPESSLDDLLKIVKGPDFPTGGIVYAGDGLRSAYATGRGSVVIRGRTDIEERGKNSFRIVVSEVPFGVNKANMLAKIAELVSEKKIVGVSDIRDETARGVVRLVIDLKKDAYPKKILNQLFKFTALQSSFHYNMLALVDGIQPRVLGLMDILSEFIKHRQIVVRRRTEFELAKAKAQAHILEGLAIALDNIDEVINIIRSSQTTEDAEKNLIDRFGLSEIQAKSILAMQLRRLAGLERQKILDELKALLEIIDKLTAILADEQKILAIIREELVEAKNQFGDDRRTEIISKELGRLTDEELIPEEQIIVTLTSANYIKRSAMTDYKKQARGGKGRRGMQTREEDNIEHLVMASTHDYVLFFTNRGRVFRLKAYEIPASSLTAKGIAIVNLLQLQPDESVSAIIRIGREEEKCNLIMCTSAGVVKKTDYEQYKNVRNSGLIAIRLDEGDELKWIRVSNESKDIIISTALGQAMRFHEKDIRSLGRASRGVKGIRLRPNDYVISMDVATNDDSVFVITENGYGKRTKVSQFTPHARGGVGIRSAVVNSKTGKLIGVATLTAEANDVIIISNQGQVIRLGLKDIPDLSRVTQGVRIMRLNSGDTVSSLTLLSEKEKLEEEDTVE